MVLQCKVKDLVISHIRAKLNMDEKCTFENKTGKEISIYTFGTGDQIMGLIGLLDLTLNSNLEVQIYKIRSDF